jgi:hypothetical protein
MQRYTIYFYLETALHVSGGTKVNETGMHRDCPANINEFFGFYNHNPSLIFDLKTSYEALFFSKSSVK